MSRRKSKGYAGILFLGAILYSCVASIFNPSSTSTSYQNTQPSTSSRASTRQIASSANTNAPLTFAEVQKSSANVLPTVTPTEIDSAFGLWGIVTADVLNVREFPNTSANIVGTLSAGECVEIVTEQVGWYGVSSDAYGGWSSSDYITLVDICPSTVAIAAPTTDATTAPVQQEAPSVESAPVAQDIPIENAYPSYAGQQFAINANLTREGWFYECFGQGDNGMRSVGAGTPIQVLGVGSFAPNANQQALGAGPYYKIRIWDGQFGWLSTSLLDADPLAYGSVSAICEEYDRIDWTTVVRAEPPTPIPTVAPVPTWTVVVATPTSSAPSWTPNNNPAPARSCCKICSKGKPCGNSCIAMNKTCRVGPGCAC